MLIFWTLYFIVSLVVLVAASYIYYNESYDTDTFIDRIFVSLMIFMAAMFWIPLVGLLDLMIFRLKDTRAAIIEKRENNK